MIGLLWTTKICSLFLGKLLNFVSYLLYDRTSSTILNFTFWNLVHGGALAQTWALGQLEHWAPPDVVVFTKNKTTRGRSISSPESDVCSKTKGLQGKMPQLSPDSDAFSLKKGLHYSTSQFFSVILMAPLKSMGPVVIVSPCPPSRRPCSYMFISETITCVDIKG